MIPNLVTKQGYVLVKQEDGSVYNLQSNIFCSRIIAGADAHKDAIIFHADDKAIPFDVDYNLIKVEDVLAWIKPEEKPAPEVSVEVVNEDNQA